MPGFIEAYPTSNLPSVVFPKFGTERVVATFPRTQKDIEESNGLRANRSRPPEEQKVQRKLNNIKKAL